MGSRFTVAVPGIEISKAASISSVSKANTNAEQTGVADFHYRQELNRDRMTFLGAIPPDFASQREM